MFALPCEAKTLHRLAIAAVALAACAALAQANVRHDRTAADDKRFLSPRFTDISQDSTDPSDLDLVPMGWAVRPVAYFGESVDGQSIGFSLAWNRPYETTIDITLTCRFGGMSKDLAETSLKIAGGEVFTIALPLAPALNLDDRQNAYITRCHAYVQQQNADAQDVVLRRSDPIYLGYDETGGWLAFDLDYMQAHYPQGFTSNFPMTEAGQTHVSESGDVHVSFAPGTFVFSPTFISQENQEMGHE